MADEPVYGLSENDRGLAQQTVRAYLADPQFRRIADPEAGLHRASDIVMVHVATTIEPRSGSATTTDCNVWDVENDTAKDYAVPIIDLPLITYIPGYYFAAIDRDGIWCILQPRTRRKFIGFLYHSYRGIVAGYWVVPTVALDGGLPDPPQWVVNILKWNFGVIGATIIVEEDIANARWIGVNQEYVCPDDREIPDPPPPEEPPTYPYPPE